MFKHMKKTASRPKLKNFFQSEPPCKALGSAQSCQFGKAPSFSKKAEIVFEKLAQVVLAGTTPAPSINNKPRYNAWAVNRVKTPQGPRYYKATIPNVHDKGFGKSQAGMSAQNKFFKTPADSLSTVDFNKLKAGTLKR